VPRIIHRAQDAAKGSGGGEKHLVLHYEAESLSKPRAALIIGHDFYGLWVER
jgi:hypothetical protein